MNTKEYIRSGIIESYVLGIATEAEREEFESMCSMYPDIAEARDAFEKAVEARLMEDAVPPPAFLKQKIEEKLTTTTTEEVMEEDEDDRTPVRRMNVWKILAAASLLLLAGTAYWAYTTNNKYQALQTENTSLKEQINESTAKLDSMNSERNMIVNPSVRMASLKSMPLAPTASGKVFWDSTSKDVFLVVNNLPQPPTDKQYQLWALINNEPVDLGMIELKEERLMLKMKNVHNAQAFAITLEPKGGSPKPTGGMYLMGNL